MNGANLQGTPNLARKPFLNTRPVVRVAILLGILGMILAAANLVAYRSFSRGQGVKQDQIEAARQAIVEEGEAIRGLEQRRKQIDLESQNAQVRFLNRKIEQRTFSWSLLFDTLTEILPRDVRISRLGLESLSEDEAERRRSTRRRASLDETALRPGEILLGIDGEARNYDAFLELLDALFQSPAFRQANPSGDTKAQSGVFRFRMHVIYLPEQAAALKESATRDGAEGTAEAVSQASQQNGAASPGNVEDGSEGTS